MLSDQDIKRELVKAKNLIIYPLKKDSINKGSINLTASKFAWNIENGTSVVENDCINIDANTTVAIVTNEHIYVSDLIKGSYHSRVSLSVKGLSNISTTLDPTWNGLSIITISNLTTSPQKINVNQEFVTLTLEYLYTKASKNGKNKPISRTDLIRSYASDEEWSSIATLAEMSVEDLRDAMKESSAYNTIRSQSWYERTKIWMKKNLVAIFIAPTISAIIAGLIVYYITK